VQTFLEHFIFVPGEPHLVTPGFVLLLSCIIIVLYYYFLPKIFGGTAFPFDYISVGHALTMTISWSGYTVETDGLQEKAGTAKERLDGHHQTRSEGHGHYLG